MSDKSDIKKAIKSIAKRNHDGYCVVCKVDSVDLSANTCYCIPLNDDADLMDVRLIASNVTGFLVIPAVNSNVIVDFLNDGAAFVSMFSEISGIKLNGDANGGLIKIDNLKTQYDANLAAIKTSVLAGLAPVDTIMAALGLPPPYATTLFNAAAASIQNLNKIPLENTTVKHGEG